MRGRARGERRGRGGLVKVFPRALKAQCTQTVVCFHCSQITAWRKMWFCLEGRGRGGREREGGRERKDICTHTHMLTHPSAHTKVNEHETPRGSNSLFPSIPVFYGVSVRLRDSSRASAAHHKSSRTTPLHVEGWS